MKDLDLPNQEFDYGSAFEKDKIKSKGVKWMINRNKLRGLMAERGIKQGELAKSIGISVNSFNMKLNEKSRFDENEIYLIAKKLRVEINYLFIFDAIAQ